MNPTDTRAQLETLFRRLSDPAVSDIEAMEACLWFRKMRLDAKDVRDALGSDASGAPNDASENRQPVVSSQSGAGLDARDTGILATALTFGKFGPKREGGAWTWGRVVREQRGYIDFLLSKASDAKKPTPPWILKLCREALASGKETTT